MLTKEELREYIFVYAEGTSVQDVSIVVPEGMPQLNELSDWELTTLSGLKWREAERLEATGFRSPTYGISNCPLCAVYNTSYPDCVKKGTAIKCPVFCKTGRPSCRNTPYTEYGYYADMMKGHNRTTTSQGLSILAGKEAEWLENLADELLQEVQHAQTIHK